MRQYSLIAILIGVLLPASIANGQQLMIKRSTISSAASFYNNPSFTLSISQVVGQTSPIKISTNNNLQISQGFLQPFNHLLDDVDNWNFTVYPNPSHGQVTFQYSRDIKGQVEVFIYSTEGKLIKSIFVSGNQPIVDLGMLTKGLYYLKVSISNGLSKTHKVILE